MTNGPPAQADAKHGSSGSGIGLPGALLRDAIAAARDEVVAGRERICEMRDYTDASLYEAFLARHRAELPKFSGPGAAAPR